MVKECAEIKVKGKTQSIEQLYFYFDRAFLLKNNFKVPVQVSFDTIMNEKIISTLSQLIVSQEEFERSIETIGMVISYASNDATQQPLAYSNKMMNKFFILNFNRHNSLGFTDFFDRFRQTHPPPLRDFEFNAVIISFPYIERKKQRESNLVQQSQIQQTQPIEQSIQMNEKCTKIRDELFLINYQIQKIEGEIVIETNQSLEASKQHSQRMAKLLESYNSLNEKNKNLLRIIHEQQICFHLNSFAKRMKRRRKTLDKQKLAYTESLQDVLQKEVQRRLREYQEVLRGKHKEEISRMERYYNFDINQRKKVTESINEVQQRNSNLIKSIGEISLAIKETSAQEREKQGQLQVIKNEIEIIDKQQKKLNDANSTSSNDVLNCKLCSDKPATIIYRPCGHLIYCERCWWDYLTDDRDPSINHIKYFCLACLEFRTICKIRGFSDRQD